jgi:hypothetical protein
MWSIAASRGFVQAIRQVNNKQVIDFTPDIRQALVFPVFAAAEALMFKAKAALPSALPYFALVCSTPTILPVVAQAA